MSEGGTEEVSVSESVSGGKQLTTHMDQVMEKKHSAVMTIVGFNTPLLDRPGLA